MKEFNTIFGCRKISKSAHIYQWNRKYELHHVWVLKDRDKLCLLITISEYELFLRLQRPAYIPSPIVTTGLTWSKSNQDQIPIGIVVRFQNPQRYTWTESFHDNLTLPKSIVKTICSCIVYLWGWFWNRIETLHILSWTRVKLSREYFVHLNLDKTRLQSLWTR